MNVMNEISSFGLTQEQYEDCVKLIVDKKNNVNDLDWSEICEKYNLPMTAESLRRVNSSIFGGAFVAEYLKEKSSLDSEKSIYSAEKTVGQNIERNRNVETSINKDGTYSSNRLLVMNEEESKDPKFILNAHGFNPDSWKLVSARNNIRQAISKDEGTVTLYSSFITAKPLDNSEISLDRISEFFDRLDRNYSLPELNGVQRNTAGDKLLLIDIADLHMNLQSSMFTTGNEYNCDIAEKLFFHVIENILSRTQFYEFSEIVFCVGGDMMNMDSLFGTTTRGTQQDNDLHFYDAYERLCSMTIKAIDILKNYAKVNVIYVMGNHDEVTGFKLAKYIDAWFRNDRNVSVDYTPMARKYKMFGKTLMCFAHDGKVQKLPAIIADEARQYWAQADTVEVFLQHLHSEQVLLEENNIRIQRLPTISGRSKWTTDNGYNSKRQCKSFVFDVEDGLIDVLYTPIKNCN